MQGTRLHKSIIRDRREFDNTSHPVVEPTDLTHKVHNVQVYKPEPHIEPPEILGLFASENTKVLCHNCGWDNEHEMGSAYTSRLKVTYTRGNSAIWDLGPGGGWLLKDYPNNTTNQWKKDYIVQEFFREKIPSLPLMESHKFIGPSLNDKFNLVIMARAKGDSMESLWVTLSEQQQADVMKDLGEHIKQWRQITNPKMQNVDGSELVDGFIGNCTGYGCIKTGSNEEEWLENLTPALRTGFLSDMYNQRKGWAADKLVLDFWVKEVDEKVTQLKADFPQG